MSEKVKIKKKHLAKKYEFIETDIYHKLSKLGILIKKNRKSLGYSEQEFARLLGISKPVVQSLERGIPNVPLSRYFMAFDLLNMTMQLEINQQRWSYSDLHDLGQFLKTQRKLSGWSEKIMAEKLQTTRHPLQTLEKGLNNVPLYRYYCVCALLHLELKIVINPKTEA